VSRWPRVAAVVEVPTFTRAKSLCPAAPREYSDRVEGSAMRPNGARRFVAGMELNALQEPVR
jgi:hypothetical protein